MKIEVDKWTLKISGLKDCDDYNTEKISYACVLMRTYLIIFTLLATYNFCYVFLHYYGENNFEEYLVCSVLADSFAVIVSLIFYFAFSRSCEKLIHLCPIVMAIVFVIEVELNISIYDYKDIGI